MNLVGNNRTCGGCCTNTTRLCHSALEGQEVASLTALLHWVGMSESSES